MNNHQEIIRTIPLGSKINPLPYLRNGWQTANSVALVYWNSAKWAELVFLLPKTAANYYFMAELSLADSNIGHNSVDITVEANGRNVANWQVNSSSIHDKLAIIPKELIAHDGLLTIVLSSADKCVNLRPIQLHTVFIDTNLAAYLKELQTGFDWVCGVRKQLLATVRKVLFSLDNVSAQPSQIKNYLQKIIDDPYVKLSHKTDLSFDLDYFRHNFVKLKEGEIHYQIRQWLDGLNNLHNSVIDVGNYFSKQLDLSLSNSSEIKLLTASGIDFDEKISVLRGKNEHLNNLEILLQKETITSTPSTLYLDITNACNFRCRMCYQSKSHFLRTNLSNRHMLMLMEMTPYLSNITVAGLGEPLLSKNLESFSTQAKILHCTPHLITNGSLISSRLNVLRNFSKVSISFDAATAKTFEAIRYRSNFEIIKQNIRLLRKEEPEMILCFSVVLSRLNIDELGQIFEIGAELGVNEISITPIEHMPFLELNSSDRQIFEEEFAAAKKIAKQYNIKINNSVFPEIFSDNNTPRIKEELLRGVKNLPIKEERHLTIEKIAEILLCHKFQYYPDPVVFYPHKWPEVTESAIPSKAVQPLLARTSFRLDEELQKINQKIEQLTAELKAKPAHFFKMPYCLDPWKLVYIKSNGTNRLCCHVDIITGNLGEDGHKASINSLECRKIRKSMFNVDDMLPECKRCQAADRYMGLRGLQELSKKHQINFVEKMCDEVNI